MISIDHVGIAVKNVEEVKQLFLDLISQGIYKTEEVHSQGVRTHFINTGSAKIELLESISQDSAVAKFIEKRKEGVHHLAFEVANIQATWNRLRSLGYTPLSAPQTGADNKLIFFLHPKETYGILLEFCQKQNPLMVNKKLPFKGGHLAYYELGDEKAPPVVLLHGAAGCTLMETELLARRLSTSFRVFALDFAGHGKSAPLEELHFTPSLFIDNVEALYNYLGIEKAHLFGFSLGGFIALAFAHRNPQRVDRLAIHAVNLIWDQKLVDLMLGRLDQEHIMNRSAELVQYLSEMHGEENWFTLFERMKTYTLELRGYFAEYAGIEKTSVPTLVSAVDKDDLFTIDSPVFLYRHLPESTLAILPGKRHALQNVDLDIFTPIIVRHFMGR